MSNSVPIPADNEDIPLPVHVFGRTVVSDCCFPPILTVEADGVLHERLRIACRFVLGWDANAAGDKERQRKNE